METITNAVNAVSGTVTRAIYGEQQPATGNETGGNEPVSGVQGKGTVTEPYDQGNSEDPANPTTRNETAGKEPVSGLQGKGTTTEPFDQGNADDATNTTNTTSLPIREKSSLENTANIPDLSAKPTIPTTDAFNSATAANASTAAQTSTFTSQETGTEGDTPADTVPEVVAESLKEAHVSPEAAANPEAVEEKKQVESELLQASHKALGHGSVGAGDADVGETKNLSETLSKTEDTSGVSSDFKALEDTTGSEPKSVSTIDNTDGPKTPALAGFGDQPTISPSDQSQIPTMVSNITSGSDFDQEKRIGGGNAGVSDTKNLSETLSKTEDSTKTGEYGKHDTLFTGDHSANAQQTAAPVDVPTSTGPSALKHTEIPAEKETKSDTGVGEEADRLVESTHKDESPATGTTHTQSQSPTGEKEKVSKMEKLKEKLHIGHKH